MPLKKGDNVEIYEDPISKKLFEGYAVLVSPVMKNASLSPKEATETWVVRFDNGDKVNRRISTFKE